MARLFFATARWGCLDPGVRFLWSTIRARFLSEIILTLDAWAMDGHYLYRAALRQM
jgi:hypothetical protein